jgi:hypothetical protein
MGHSATRMDTILRDRHQEQDFLPGFPQAGIYYETAVSILLVQLLDEMLSIQQNFILT